MQLTPSFAVFVVGGVSLFPAAYAWGAAGIVIFPIAFHDASLNSFCRYRP